MGKEEEKVGEGGGRLELDRSAVVENQFWEQYFQKHTVGGREGEHRFTKWFQNLECPAWNLKGTNT